MLTNIEETTLHGCNDLYFRQIGTIRAFVVYIVVIKLILNLGVKLILLSKVGFEEYKNSFKSIKKITVYYA